MKRKVILSLQEQLTSSEKILIFGLEIPICVRTIYKMYKFFFFVFVFVFCFVLFCFLFFVFCFCFCFVLFCFVFCGEEKTRKCDKFWLGVQYPIN